MTCSNCTSPAKHLFQAPGVADQPYCSQHLPEAYRGSEWVVEAPEDAPTEVLETAEVLETPEDEDPNPILQEDKPKTRRTRKSPGER